MAPEASTAVLATPDAPEASTTVLAVADQPETAVWAIVEIDRPQTAPLAIIDRPQTAPLAIADRPQTIRCFTYKNAAHPGFVNQLWVSEYGSVLYFGRKGNTGWHGRFAEMRDNMASLDFDCHGDETNLKHTLLMQSGNGSYISVDYMQRRITMTLLYRLQYANSIYSFLE